MEASTANTIATIISFGIIIFIFLYAWIWMKWFPVYFYHPTKFRIKEKKKGKLTYYRPEVWRPIFGWSGIWTSKYNGSISRDNSWTSQKSDCEENIAIFKLLKNIN